MPVAIVTGSARYADPWHPVTETSAEIAAVVRALGLPVDVRTDDSPESLSDLSGVDLLIVNSGGGDPEDPPTYEPSWQPCFDAIAAHVASGRPLLAVHSAANAFPDWPGWADIIGATWVRGVSGHPERSFAVFEADPSAAEHPVFDGLPSIHGVTDRPTVVCYDERYWRMTLHDGNRPLLGHDTLGSWYPVGWARGERVLYDGLGHDRTSYASLQRRRYLANEIRWLLRGRIDLPTTQGEL